jgi:hypothetical protein
VLEEVEEEVEVVMASAEHAWSTEHDPVFLQMNSPATRKHTVHSAVMQVECMHMDQMLLQKECLSACATIVVTPT